MICQSIWKGQSDNHVFYEELKRRNVTKVAILYAVSSWLILQIAEVLFNAMDLPLIWVRLVLAILILGFPLAMIFSWVFEMTPQGLKRETEVDRNRSSSSDTGRKVDVLIIVMLALAIGAVILEQLMGRVSPYVLIGVVVLLVVATIVLTRLAPATATGPSVIDQVDADESSGADSSGDPAKTIAVLPFVNMSSDQEQEYFSDGLSEELLNLLSRIPDLRVVARTSSFSYKDKSVKVAKIGQDLNVAYILEGSVRKSGNRVRITAQLIHAGDGYHLWSETYDRTLDDVFAIQDEIAAVVVAQVKIKLLNAAPVVEETDPGAYALFLRARHLGRQGAARPFEQAIELYQQALAIVPNYVAAWDGLSAVYSDQADRGERPIEEGYALAREAVERVLTIDPDFARGHASRAMIAFSHDRDLESAARHLERALELDPTDLEILVDAGDLLLALGRLDEAIVLQKYVLSRDPINARSHRRAGSANLWAMRLDDAIKSYHVALTLSPGMVGVQQLIGFALLLKGEPEAALAAMQEESDKGWRRIGMAAAYHSLGKSDESDSALAKTIERNEQVASFNIAFLLAFRGEADRAFEWLDKAAAYNDPGLAQVTNIPMFANIHGDPRWLLFLESIGKSPQQLAAIDFKVTLPE